MTFVVVNRKFGGFGLSQHALHLLRAMGHPLALQETDIGERWPGKSGEGDILLPDHPNYNRVSSPARDAFMDSFLTDIPRTDKALLLVVQFLKEKANAPHAKLEIVEIPNDVEWEISEYDGTETIEEKHRKW